MNHGTLGFDPVALTAKFKATGGITFKTGRSYQDLQREKVREAMRRKRREEKRT